MFRHADVEAVLEVAEGDEGVRTHQQERNRDGNVALDEEAEEHAEECEQDDYYLLVPFGEVHDVVVVQDVLDNGRVYEHGGVVFFVRARHKVEQGGCRRPEDEDLALVHGLVVAVHRDVVVRKVLERAAFLVGVESSDIVHEVAAVVVDRHAFDGAEAVFLAGTQTVDLILGCRHNVADDLVVHDGKVGDPFLCRLVVTEVRVDTQVLGLVDGEVGERIAEVADGVEYARRDDDFFVVVRVVDEELDVRFTLVFASDRHAFHEFLFFALVECKQGIAFDSVRDIEEQLGFRRIERLAVKQREEYFAVLVLGGDDLLCHVDDVVGGALLSVLALEELAKLAEHRVAVLRVGRVECSGRIAVDAERLANLDVAAHLYLDVFRVLVEQVQDCHQGHRGIHAARNVFVGVRVRVAVEHGHVAHHAVVVGVGVHGTHQGTRMGKFRVDIVKKRLGLDVGDGIDLRVLEGGAEPEFLGAVVGGELFPDGLVAERRGIVHHEAYDGVPALLDFLDHQGVEVVVRADIRKERVVLFRGIERVQYADGLLRLFLAEVGALEQNIEADSRRSALVQVLDDVSVDGPVPFIVVSEFRKGVLVDIDDHDIGLEAVAHRHLAVFFELFEGLSGLYLEELVVKDVFHVFGGGTGHGDIRILRVAEEENKEDYQTGKD